MASKSIRLSVPAGINQKRIRPWRKQALAIRCEVVGYCDLSWRTFSLKAGSTVFQSATTP
jgi:hypothetical protein